VAYAHAPLFAQTTSATCSYNRYATHTVYFHLAESDGYSRGFAAIRSSGLPGQGDAQTAASPAEPLSNYPSRLVNALIISNTYKATIR